MSNIEFEVGRARVAAESIHSVEMEGLIVSAEARGDSQEYIVGRIDAGEMVRRAQSRYGVE